MALTKYASYEGAQVLDLKGSSERIKSASLQRIAEYGDFRTEDGFLYARIRAISSRVNRNHDGWPSVELAGGQDVFDRHLASQGGFVVEADASQKYGYSTFLGKPIFVDHHNSNPERARGVVVDAKLHVEDHRTASELDSYYASAPDNHMPPTWVELLLEVDAKSFPRLAKAIINGSRDPSKGINGFSMGCNVERSICNICKNAATSPDDFCKHIRLKGAHFDYVDPRTGRKTSKRSYEDCYGVQFFEISAVFDPADETALLREVRAGIEKEANELWEGGNYNPNSFSHDVPQVTDMEAPIECPTCHGFDENCPTCHGQNNIISPVPGHDGMISPLQVMPYVTDESVDPNKVGLGPVRQGAVHTADNPLPQSELIHAPESIDTMRKEHICDVCGAEMDSETCDRCGWTEPPDSFNNPDLSKAQETDLHQDQGQPGQGGEGDHAPQNPALTPTNDVSLAHVTTSNMGWTIEHPKVAAQRPLPGVPVRPSEQVVKDQDKPVTSSVRTAEDFFAAAGATTRRTMDTHTADAASGAPEVAKPDVNVDVTGVGGVQDASNEQASQAEAQINVEGVGGTGVESVDADKTVNVEQGDEHSKNIEAIPTKTFDDGSSAVERQHDPVSSDPFPVSGEGVKASSWHIEALDASPFPADDGGLSGGTTVQGVQPVDPVGTAQDRVDLLQAVTSPENNSGPTTTWSGTDGNGVLRQQEPVTTEPWVPSDEGVKSSAHLFSAFRLADLEIELGLLSAEKKYERVAELEQRSAAALDAELAYAKRVKTAGLGRQSKVARRLPVLGRNSSVDKEAAVEQTELPDSALFS